MRSKIDPRSPIYQRAVRREAKFWQGQAEDPVTRDHLPAPLIEYQQLCETGDAHTDRFEFYRKLGPFQKGLSIGCGSANVERELLKRGIVKEFTFIDISEASLQKLQSSLPRSMRKRVQIMRQDLNFIELEEGTYDFIFCANVLHHIVNLEHVLLELNKSLTEDGLLVVNDFVGESRFQFSDKRIAAINAIARRAHEQTGVHYTSLVRTARKSLINSCPFEAVRSGDLLTLLTELHNRRTVRQEGYGAVLWIDHVLNFHPQTKNERAQLEKAVKLFISEDKRLKKTLGPLFIYGTYRKNLHPPAWQVRKWTKAELRHHLPVSRFDEGIILRLSTFLRSAIGEGAAYNTLRKTYLAIRR